MRRRIFWIFLRAEKQQYAGTWEEDETKKGPALGEQDEGVLWVF
jgi:hypothetical protein